jgi:eukaryotic-like serine/threonine-protein kinase
MKYFLLLLLMSITECKAQQLSILSKATYTVQYPADWKVKPGSDVKQCDIISPTVNAADEFVENLNLVIETLPDNSYTAEKYAAFSKGYLPQKIKKFVVLQNKKASINGKDSWYMVFKGYQSNKLVQWKQYYVVHNKKVHILTFSAAAESYKEYEKIFTQMAEKYVVK